MFLNFQRKCVPISWVDMRWSVSFIVTLTLCSHIAIGHRHGFGGFRHWWNWERDPSELPQIKGGRWYIQASTESDSNEYDSIEPNSNDYDSDGPDSNDYDSDGPDSNENDSWETSTSTSTRAPDIKTSFTTGSPIPTSTPVIFSTTLSEDLETCLKNCPVTSDYNPVCGTNNVTYSNTGQLLCNRQCGVDVDVWKHSTCTKLDDDDNGTDITSLSVSPNGWNTPFTSPVSPITTQCIRSCPVTPEYNPVCGTNGITYNNPGHLLCDQLCGVDVRVKKIAACLGENNNNAVPLSTNADVGQTTPLQLRVEACIKTCPTSPEDNPVCGTNGVTYKNALQLLCHRICGLDIQASPCTTITKNNNGNEDGDSEGNVTIISSTNTPTTVNEIGSLAIVIEDCIRRCPRTPEYNPVCGTNNVTYNNPGHLGCAQACGATVQLRRQSACPPRITSTESPDEDNADVSLNGSNEDNNTTPRSVNNAENSSTINPDVLKFIFNGSTNAESNNDFSIDPRSQDISN